jgi:signal transduction histidine kinase
MPKIFPSIPAQPSLKRLYGLGLAAVFMIAILAALSLAYLHKQIERTAVNNTLSLARTLDLIFAAQISAIDATVLAARDEIGQQLDDGHARREYINTYLETLSRRLPNADAIRATNVHGTVVYGPGLPTPPSNVSDRNYFRQLRDDPTMGLFVDNAMVGRIDRQWVWPFARRINTSDGDFAGVVYSRMRTTEIEKMLTQFPLDHKGVIAIRDKDFGLVASYQAGGTKEVLTGDRRVSGAFLEVLKAHPLEGSYTENAHESSDGVGRTYAYRHNPKYQFLVSVGVDRDVALSTWRQQAWIAGVFVFIFSIGILVVVMVRRKALMREEAASQESDIFRRAIIDAITDEIAVLDHHGNITAVNQPWLSFARSNGLVAESTPLKIGIGVNYLEVCQAAIDGMKDDYALRALLGIQGVLERRLPSFTMDYPCDAPEGQQWFTMVVTPLNLPSGGAVVAHNNVTESRLAEDALRAAKAEAELANKAKSRFLAAASHDLRQPLAAMTLYVDILTARAAERDRTVISKIGACCASLSELLTKLLDVSKLDAGVTAVNLSNVVVDDVLSSLVTVHSAEANSKGLHLRWRPSPGTIVRTDAVLLTRMVGNLIANAIQFTKTGGILVACRQRAGALSLEVWDTGIGIPTDKIEEAFQEFTKLSDIHRSQGSGLGLSIVAKTAKLLGVAIRVQSTLGRGSMFAIELPRGSTNGMNDTIPNAPIKRPLRIGLVEDNAQLMEAMVIALTSEGHAVVEAVTGHELLTRLNGVAPDIVISDYRLTAEETGFDVVAMARTVFGNSLPAIITTGDTDPMLMRSMVEHGIEIHYKPLRMDDLQRAIFQATGHHTP